MAGGISFMTQHGLTSHRVFPTHSGKSLLGIDIKYYIHGIIIMVVSSYVSPSTREAPNE